MNKLTLLHEREGHAYNGFIVFKDSMGGLIVDTFTGFVFARMMARFASQAIRHPTAALYMARTEKEDLEPYLLDDKTSRQLREDPASVIQSMTVDHRVVERVKAQLEDGIKVKDEVKLQLRGGHDTMADAFGDFVYIKLRPHDTDGMQGECPFTGKWIGFGANANNTSQLLLKTGRENAHADWLPIELVGGSKVENPRWVRVKTEDLLLHTLKDGYPERFFIPRKWNETSPWIKREKLGVRFSQYKKEKADV